MHNGVDRPRRGRGRGIPQPSSTRHEEDSQPNETIDKRRVLAPPSIRTVAVPQRYKQPPRSFGRGRGLSSARGYGHISGGYRSTASNHATDHSRHTFRHSTNSGTSYNSDSRSTHSQSASFHNQYQHQTGVQPWNHTRNQGAIRERIDFQTGNRRETFPRPCQNLSWPSTFAPDAASRSEIPSKRRRIDADNSSQYSRDVEPASPPEMGSSNTMDARGDQRAPSPSVLTEEVHDRKPPVAIKQEPRSPSPPVRRLVTSGCTRYAPLPSNCQRGASFYRAKRKEWAQCEMAKLETRGVRPTKWLTREDGMVIEWTSPQPVWSDTLESNSVSAPPLVRAITSTGLANEGCDVHQNVASNTSSHPEPANQIADTPTIGETTIASPHPDLIETIETVSSDVGPPQALLDVTPPSRISPSLSEYQIAPQSAIDVNESELGDLSLKFIESYMQMFDINRTGVLAAYHPSAFFSFKVHSPRNSFHPGTQASLSLPRNVFHGQERIGRALRLLSSYKVCQEETSIAYDLLPTDVNCLLMCYGTATNIDTSPSSSVYFGQSFVLQRNYDASHADRWPLVAISHQITIGQFAANIYTPD